MDINIENLKMVYSGRKVLDIGKLAIKKGDLCGIIGPNGAGKSTLLNIISGLEKQTEGKVFYGDGRQVQLPSKDMTMVFQRPYLLRTTAEKNIAYPLKLRGMGQKDIDLRTQELISEMGLSHVKKQRAHTLSAGESQKVALCRALSFRPELLMLDEPTANIDPSTTAELELMLKKINEKDGTTIIIITHNLAQAKRICNRVIFLNKGIVEESGDKEQIFNNPRNPLTGRFIHGDLLI